ncbi:ketohydroxyglutarate aldolase [Leptolyngbya sp. BL0902]|uniref:bifunctional 4-hydroxy-2-oxoglutarate aldolase/2-dehydro-3-deoxy-phosphogluconate aldolase n=1 Tax=Leptolyngbya sp. BL0902 TaxID=1115757 RepID=UPI0018E75E64|nr:bifunctional 4-hydroxy-2-oxoglutarate aldolase/2-dehydro-3-deoxy-phosphogluconate aldolase [Leptolyngbya sp. BL0902]QQE67236.1 ketohydroxyglutarate aldolase [Leptolyngbya sp. BL0902]
MDTATFLETLRQQRAIAVLRAPRFDLGLRMAEAAAAGGVRLIEITWNSDQPDKLVTHLRQALPHCWIGVGTVLSMADLQAAMAAGAEFGFSPYTDPDLLQWAVDRQWPLVSGALTPSEIGAAWRAGAPAVKVFPVWAMGGPSYLRSLQAPLGHIPLVPTGGLTLDQVESLLHAGATAVGLSTGLFPAQALAQEDWATITDLARQLIGLCQTARSAQPQGQKTQGQHSPPLANALESADNA